MLLKTPRPGEPAKICEALFGSTTIEVMAAAAGMPFVACVSRV